MYIAYGLCLEGQKLIGVEEMAHSPIPSKMAGRILI
jgi:hypothetical protein